MKPYRVFLMKRFSIYQWSFSVFPRWAAWRKGATLEWQSSRSSAPEVRGMLHLFLDMGQRQIRDFLLAKRYSPKEPVYAPGGPNDTR